MTISDFEIAFEIMATHFWMANLEAFKDARFSVRTSM